LETIAEQFSLPLKNLKTTLMSLPTDGLDEFGRHFSNTPLQPPYYAVRVTGALFHTQGGLEVTGAGRVLHQSGECFPNLFAGGGAACGVSGDSDIGYLSGNGLLSAVVLGYNAGAFTL
jgi:fumarate reductase flavoprotein subunit